jgi:hypothetical protein
MTTYPRRPQQALVVAAATIAALVAYWLMTLLDVDFMLKDGTEVGAAEVGVTALAAGLLGWLVFELLARTGRAHWWPSVGSVALAISILGPSYEADGKTAVALIVLHFVVAIIMIAGLSATSSRVIRSHSSAH